MDIRKKDENDFCLAAAAYLAAMGSWYFSQPETPFPELDDYLPLDSPFRVP